MDTVLSLFARKINALNEWVGKATSWLTAALVILVCFDVVARKLFNFSKVWIMDLEWHLFALIFLMAAGYALKHDRHVRVDLFYADLPAKEKAQVDFWGTFLFLIPWCVAVMLYSWHYAWDALITKEGASEPGGLPMRYVIKFCIVAGTALLLLQALTVLIESGKKLFQKINHTEPTDL
jgi:TRAP-type mannitol/chloroaromatic compound transport system permease small subunit